MTMEATDDVTRMLKDWSQGDSAAAEKVLPLIYEELRRAASSAMARMPFSHTLGATALVNEAYLRICERSGGHWQNRNHFFAAAAQQMRHILVDSVRRRVSQKRGGDLQPVTLEESLALAGERRPPDILALDDALTALAKIDARKARIVELRFFGGMTLEETAQDLGISTATTHREWRRARAWLYNELVADGR